MNTLIFPTDFSATSRQAMQFAAPIARTFDAQILLIHSIYLPPTPGELGAVMIQADLNKAREELSDYLHELKKDPAYAGITFNSLLGTGPIVQEVNDAIEQTGCELVVMGTAGASGLEGLFLGSNTSKMIRDAKAPVLAVPNDIDFQGINDVVFATDFADPEEEAFVIHELIDFCRPFDAHIHVVHVTDPDHRFSLEQVDALAVKYPEQFNYPKISFKIQVAEKPMEGLQEFVAAHKTDIVALLTKRRGFFNSIFHASLTRKMALKGEVPILSFHG